MFFNFFFKRKKQKKTFLFSVLIYFFLSLTMLGLKTAWIKSEPRTIHTGSKHRIVQMQLEPRTTRTILVPKTALLGPRPQAALKG